MIAFQFRATLVNRHALMAVSLLLFSYVYWIFDKNGGYYHSGTHHYSGTFWIILPTIEGVIYGMLIAWYDNSFEMPATGVSKFIGLIGTYSYSIYLLHFFVVFDVARFVNERIMPITNFYLACAWSFLFLLCMMPIGYISFRYIELPFLRFRKNYILP